MAHNQQLLSSPRQDTALFTQPTVLFAPSEQLDDGELHLNEVLRHHATCEDRAAALLASMRNILIMHTLERIAATFNEAAVELLVLKGGALNLTLYDQPDQRPMTDIDLLIKPERLEDARALLEKMGALRGEEQVREDFFPRFYYETEYKIGHPYPVWLDLHVRPFRPLRYSKLVPPTALWAHARAVPIGQATVLLPSDEDMLIHLAVHAAIHGYSQPMWLQDIKCLADARRGHIDWDRFLSAVRAWRLGLPVRQAICRVQRDLSQVCPPEVLQALSKVRVSWRDRLALWQAPRDANHPRAHVAVNALCTPGRRFVLSYLLAVLIPDRTHMADWYRGRHWAWLPCAHVLRWSWPIVKWIPRFATWFTKIETKKSPIHGTGVFSTQDIEIGETIARYRGKAVDRDSPYVGLRETEGEHTQRYEITGKLRHLNHHSRPNAQLRGFKLVALKLIRAGEEITISYGHGCDCKQAAATPEDLRSQDAA